MEQTKIPGKHKLRRVRLIILISTGLLVSFVVAWCWFGPLATFHPSRAPEVFPDAEIIYNAEGEWGFVNADGTGFASFPIRYGYTNFHSSPNSPFVLNDPNAIFVTYSSSLGYRGKIISILPGKKPVFCDWYGTIQIAGDGFHILLDTGNAIEKYLPSDCGTDNPPEETYSRDLSLLAVLSPNEQYIAEVRGGDRGIKVYIVIRNLETGNEKNLGNGSFPVWSRDGKWLAFTGNDGIYVAENTTNAVPRLLVPLEKPNPYTSLYTEDKFIEYLPPIASWSPDGQWLVYHTYNHDLVDPEAGAWAGHYSIFKTNLKTGETVKLLDGGYSPSWRWPVQP